MKKFFKNIILRNKITPENTHNILKKGGMLVDGYTNMVLDLEKSKGQYMYDSLNNRKILDLGGFFGSSPISHNHEDMNNSQFIEEIGKVALHKPSNSDFYTAEMAKFVDIFKRMCMPEPFKYLFMIDGGASANENSLKTAFDWKKRKNMEIDENELEIIHFKNAFHGRSGFTLSLTNTDPIKYKYFPKFDWKRFPFPTLKYPNYSHNYFNNVSRETIIMNKMTNYIKQNNKKIAAIITEPFQGEGGNNFMSDRFWKFLRDICDKYEMLLIADEVQTSLSTGKIWAYEHLGPAPDIICFGKKFQVCGIISTGRIDDVKNHVFQLSSRINSTFGANLTDMVRCTKYLEIINKYNYLENVDFIGTYVLQELEKIPLINNIRGKGLFIAFDLPNTKLRDSLIEKLMELNVLVLPCGKNSIRLRPKLDIEKHHVNEFIFKLDTAIKKLK